MDHLGHQVRPAQTPDPGAETSSILSLQTIFVPIKSYGLKSYFCSHLTSGETEAEEGMIPCSKAQSQPADELGPSLKSPTVSLLRVGNWDPGKDFPNEASTGTPGSPEGHKCPSHLCSRIPGLLRCHHL